jgi:DNA-binding XRE family transcriptional regulator
MGLRVPRSVLIAMRALAEAIYFSQSKKLTSSANNVKRLRKARAVTQEDLAVDAGIDMRYLDAIERGQENPTIAVIANIAKALEVHGVRLGGSRRALESL